MIPRAYITAWRSVAPWSDDAQVEQDLMLSRALVALFSDERINTSFAMRGGTAMHKLVLNRSLRYSEDIDLVQVVAGPTKPFFDALHERVDPWLGEHSYEHRTHSVRAVYRFETEAPPVRRMRLKIEANTREHFTVLGLREQRYRVSNPWFEGEVDIPTFELAELLGTKLRALYQRRKGRDLFDLHQAGREDGVELDRVITVFRAYLEHQGLEVTRAALEDNLLAKVGDRHFRADVIPLLAPGVEHDVDEAAAWVMSELAGRLP
jgi:predicted nucleotidyltransferase component of viral defense system